MFSLVYSYFLCGFMSASVVWTESDLMKFVIIWLDGSRWFIFTFFPKFIFTYLGTNIFEKGLAETWVTGTKGFGDWVQSTGLAAGGNHNCLSFALNSFLFNPSFPNSTLGIFQWRMILMSSLATRSDTFKDKMSNVCENSSIIVNSHKMQILLGM